MAKQTPEIPEQSSKSWHTDPEKKPSQRGPGRPPVKNITESSHSFFESCGRIDPDDWGTRCWVYVYRKEPVIDRTGDWHYVDKYDENPKSEDRILADHGSGKYRLMLNFQKPGATRSDTLDSVVLLLINVKFPPRVAPGEWVDDTRNRRWAWAKDSFPKPESNGAGAVLETLRVFNDIRKGVQDEEDSKSSSPPPNPVSQVRETIQALKELAPQPAPAATENQTLQSIVQLIISQSKQQADQSTAQITAQATQNNTLLQALLAQRNPSPANSPSLTEVISVVSDKLIPLIEKLKPSAEDAINTFTKRSRMSGWQEMIQPAIPAALEWLKPFAVATATRLMNPAGANAAASPAAGQGMGAVPGQLAGQPASPQVPGAVSGFPPVLNMLAVPLMGFMRIEADPRELGKDFADWVHDGYAQDTRFSQALALARASGPDSIIVAFKASPYWLDRGLNHDLMSLSDMEPKFRVFLDSFLSWRPQDEPEEEDLIDITGGEIQ